MDKRRIEKAALDLLGEIWGSRKYLWPDGEPSAIEMLSPEVAAQVLGVSYEVHPELRLVKRRGDATEVGGILDRQAGKIAVADKFGILVARFTGMHEVGHFVMHKDQVVIHRDAPIRGIERSGRALFEREADYFSACALVPEKLLRKAVKERFGNEAEIPFDDNTAFKLCGQDPDSILDLDVRGRAFAIASARSFGPPPFTALSEYFRVSVSVMAYRLLEVGIVGSTRTAFGFDQGS
jgi:hypothetical protein